MADPPGAAALARLLEEWPPTALPLVGRRSPDPDGEGEIVDATNAVVADVCSTHLAKLLATALSAAPDLLARLTAAGHELRHLAERVDALERERDAACLACAQLEGRLARAEAVAARTATLIDALPRCMGPYHTEHDEALPFVLGARTCPAPATHYLVNGDGFDDGICAEHLEPTQAIARHGVNTLPWGEALAACLAARSPDADDATAFSAGRQSQQTQEMKMNIGEAVKAMKEGKRILRSGWNGKRMYLFLVRGSRDAAATGFPPWTYTDGAQDGYPLASFVAMKTAGDEVIPWNCSQADLLADDWTVVAREGA